MWVQKTLIALFGGQSCFTAECNESGNVEDVDMNH